MKKKGSDEPTAKEMLKVAHEEATRKEAEQAGVSEAEVRAWEIARAFTRAVDGYDPEDERLLEELKKEDK